MKRGHRQTVARGGLAAALALCGLLCGWAPSAAGQPVSAATEQSVKAAYLYKFAAYVEWPEEVFAGDSAPIAIGVFGADSLADELRKMTAGRSVHGRSISIREIRAPEELAGIQILFIAGAAAGDIEALSKAARRHSALVVTEAGDALQYGSVINFRPVDQRIRFDVSLDSADRNRLKLSSRLLAVAHYVEPRGR